MTRIYLLCEHYDDYSIDEVINAFTSKEKAIEAGRELAKEPFQLIGNTYTDRKLWTDYTEYCHRAPQLGIKMKDQSNMEISI